MRLAALAVGIIVVACPATVPVDAQGGSTTPRVELRSAPTLELPGTVDSNSPAVWERVGNRDVLYVMTSVSGQPTRAWGRDLANLGLPRPATFSDSMTGGLWMEAILQDADGTWYGYYHNEIPAAMCPGIDKVIPRIGAARSQDRGATWEPLGLVLEAPPRTHDCRTTNTYFVGGVGDFSVQLDDDGRDVYFFYSSYLRSPSEQGVGIARLAWADRDAPTGKAAVWSNGVWLPATSFTIRNHQRWIHPAGTPIFPAAQSWHDGGTTVDAYWGPSVHWNTYLSQYVMLLTRAKDVDYGTEGIYVSFAPSLDPPQWSRPARILNGGTWYPQIMGLDIGSGTDKVAGEWARFYMLGTSRHLIRFLR